MREKLLEIGLTDPEAKVYLELLAIGTQVASILAKRLKINRTTIYSVLRNLGMKGLVSSRVKSNVKFFSANDPNCLIGYLDRQSKIYEYYKGEMLGIIPNFRSLMKKEMKLSELAESWNISDKETEEIKKNLRKGWKK